MKFFWKSVFLLFVGSGAAFAQTFTFSAIPDEDETRLKQRFDKVADYLAGKRGLSAHSRDWQGHRAAGVAAPVRVLRRA